MWSRSSKMDLSYFFLILYLIDHFSLLYIESLFLKEDGPLNNLECKYWAVLFIKFFIKAIIQRIVLSVILKVAIMYVFVWIPTVNQRKFSAPEAKLSDSLNCQLRLINYFDMKERWNEWLIQFNESKNWNKRMKFIILFEWDFVVGLQFDRRLSNR